MLKPLRHLETPIQSQLKYQWRCMNINSREERIELRELLFRTAWKSID